MPATNCTARVCVDALYHIVEFIVFSSCSHAVILGWYFLSAADAVINCGRYLLELSETVETVSVHPSSLKVACEEDTSLPLRTLHSRVVQSHTYEGGEELHHKGKGVPRHCAVSCLFLPQLWGCTFYIVTGHHAFCWLSSFQDPSGQSGRWMLRIPEYDYNVLYKSGRKQGHADS